MGNNIVFSIQLNGKELGTMQCPTTPENSASVDSLIEFVKAEAAKRNMPFSYTKIG